MGRMQRLLVQREGGLTRIQLNRPKRAHAYDRRMLEELDGSISGRVIVLSSGGDGAFCGGADLNELAQAHPLDALNLYSQAVFDRLAQHTGVSICVVHGAAVAGGFELALACDLRIASPRASFRLPELDLGLLPSGGGCTRLTALIGPARTREVILTRRTVDAQTALTWGMVNEIHDDPLARAEELAQSMLGLDAVALRMTKQVLLAPSLEKERVAEALLYHQRRKE